MSHSLTMSFLDWVCLAKFHQFLVHNGSQLSQLPPEMPHESALFLQCHTLVITNFLFFVSSATGERVGGNLEGHGTAEFKDGHSYQVS